MDEERVRRGEGRGKGRKGKAQGKEQNNSIRLHINVCKSKI
jgi:hypothetical protein